MRANIVGRSIDSKRFFEDTNHQHADNHLANKK